MAAHFKSSKRMNAVGMKKQNTIFVSRGFIIVPSFRHSPIWTDKQTRRKRGSIHIPIKVPPRIKVMMALASWAIESESAFYFFKLAHDIRLTIRFDTSLPCAAVSDPGQGSHATHPLPSPTTK